MEWLELSVNVSSEYVEPVSELFRKYGEGSVVILEDGDWDIDVPEEVHGAMTITVVTYLPVDTTTTNRRTMIDTGMRLISYIRPMENIRERLLNEDECEAAWKAHFTILRIGQDIVIKPTWETYAASDNEKVVELDPGMAFGTGYHPTTSMCLQEIEKHILPDVRVLDLGSGSGILSIAAAKLGASAVIGLDIDPVAVEVGRNNILQNNVSSTIEIFHGTLPHPKVSEGTIDMLIANITAKMIVDVADIIPKMLTFDGIAILSGIIIDSLPEVEAALSGHLVVIDKKIDEDWVVLVANRK